MFPKRTNVEFVRVLDKKTVAMRVWERAGETLACGTGGAVLVSSVLNGLTERAAAVKLWEETFIEWNEQDNHVYMTGPDQGLEGGFLKLYS